MTDTRAHVYEAINAITADMAKEGIAKTGRNQQQGYNFRGIDAVYKALAPKLAEHKLCMLPRVMEREQVERETRNGGALFYTMLTVEFDLVSSVDGTMHTVRVIGEAMDSADKSSNKAMSAAYKYAAIQTFAVPVDGEDNDADTTTHEVLPKPRKDTPNRELFSKLIETLRTAGNKDWSTLRATWLDPEFQADLKKLPKDWQRDVTAEKDAFVAVFTDTPRPSAEDTLDKQFGGMEPPNDHQ